MSTIPLRVNLQMLYRWSWLEHEYCQYCKGPIGYGALAEVYTPPTEPDHSQTEAESFQAADDYCNALANRQEQGDFTIHAMYPVCGDCAARVITEDVGGEYPALLVADAREHPQEYLWMAVCMHYEPGAYGKYQSFVVHSYIPTPIETIYAMARQGEMSDEPRFELHPYPDNGPHRSTQRVRRSSPHSKKKRRR